MVLVLLYTHFERLSGLLYAGCLLTISLASYCPLIALHLHNLLPCPDICNFAVITFADDNDQYPDSSGEYTGASLTKPDMPKDFTICAAYMVEAWTTGFTSAYLFRLNDRDGDRWGYVKMFADESHTEFSVYFSRVSFTVISEQVLFPLTWTRVCVSLDTVSGKVVLVTNGEVLQDEVYAEAMEEDKWRPAELDMVLGKSRSEEYTGIISQVNIFSSPLPTARMVAQTEAGGEECGAPGDYVSWEEEDWTVHSKARLVEMVGELEKPCRRESEVTVYTADFEYHSAATNPLEISGCMEHCQKLGQGRSPPVQSLADWDWVTSEVRAITPDISPLPDLWLAVTDEGVEGEWRDAYPPHDQLNTSVAWPWRYSIKDTEKGDNQNCIHWRPYRPDDRCWVEMDCTSYEMACPCQYTQTPILRLRGLCQKSALKPEGGIQYTPKQLAWDPHEVFLVGQVTTQIRYNDSSEQWVITDALSRVRAESKATKVSYVLGKHKWKVTGDLFACHEGQPYTTILKLTGCNPEGEFTCNDGQCVTMEQRCNQVANCRDKSDEIDCKLLVLENNYNKKVPPIVPTGGDGFNRTHVGISVSLLKIVSMEEVQHKIDLQFEITLEWKENRAVYHNLKVKKSLNALTDADIVTLWLPYVIYANTDMKEAVQLEDELKTNLVVTREGNFIRNSNIEIDETEVFKGKDNTLAMFQTYTKSFQCQYHLQNYPFDTQVSYRFVLFPPIPFCM